MQQDSLAVKTTPTPEKEKWSRQKNNMHKYSHSPINAPLLTTNYLVIVYVKNKKWIKLNRNLKIYVQILPRNQFESHKKKVK